VIAGNNRGAAFAYPLPHRSGTRVLGGAWFERLEDASLDIDAWIAVALAAGARRIVLLGHSLGAIKAILYASDHPERRLAGLVLASPPLRAFAAAPDPAVVSAATAAVAEGKPQLLIDLPAPGLLFGCTSAATVLSRSAVGDPAPRLRSIGCPILALYGTEEVEIGGQSDLDRLSGLAPHHFTGALVANANHLYADREREAASVVSGWIGSALERQGAETVSR
jgi:pimeloyl-ACP methyl ester carboxylesterase